MAILIHAKWWNAVVFTFKLENAANLFRDTQSPNSISFQISSQRFFFWSSLSCTLILMPVIYTRLTCQLGWINYHSIYLMIAPEGFFVPFRRSAPLPLLKRYCALRNRFEIRSWSILLPGLHTIIAMTELRGDRHRGQSELRNTFWLIRWNQRYRLKVPRDMWTLIGYMIDTFRNTTPSVNQKFSKK